MATAIREPLVTRCLDGQLHPLERSESEGVIVFTCTGCQQTMELRGTVLRYADNPDVVKAAFGDYRHAGR